MCRDRDGGMEEKVVTLCEGYDLQRRRWISDHRGLRLVITLITPGPATRSRRHVTNRKISEPCRVLIRRFGSSVDDDQSNLDPASRANDRPSSFQTSPPNTSRLANEIPAHVFHPSVTIEIRFSWRIFRPDLSVSITHRELVRELEM